MCDIAALLMATELKFEMSFPARSDFYIGAKVDNADGRNDTTTCETYVSAFPATAAVVVGVVRVVLSEPGGN